MDIYFLGTHYILINTGGQSIPVDVAIIIYCEAYKDYTKFNIENSPVIIACGCLKTYEEKLQKYSFARIHDKYLVNMRHIKRFPYRSPDKHVFLRNGAMLEVSRRKEKDVYPQWKKFIEGK